MSRAILDASLLVQAVVKEEFTDMVLKLLQRLEEVIVPPLALYEAGNALVILSRRGLIGREEAVEKYKLIASMPTLKV